MARIAHARRCGRFEWMALDWNERAIRFYKALGAVEMAKGRLFRVTGESPDSRPFVRTRLGRVVGPPRVADV